MFKKFPSDDSQADTVSDNSEADLDVQLDATVPARLRGDLTRSSMKPRLLFPTAKQVQVREQKLSYNTEDEEAVTDIEDASDFETPREQIHETTSTPRAPLFAPASPPTTTRITRFGKKTEGDASPLADEVEIAPVIARRGRGGKVSPFDTWKRTKLTKLGESKKRDGSPMTRDPSKRLRGPNSGL